MYSIQVNAKIPMKKVPAINPADSEVCAMLQYNNPAAYKKKMTSGTAMCVRVSFSKTVLLNSRFVPVFFGLMFFMAVFFYAVL